MVELVLLVALTTLGDANKSDFKEAVEASAPDDREARSSELDPLQSGESESQELQADVQQSPQPDTDEQSESAKPDIATPPDAAPEPPSENKEHVVPTEEPVTVATLFSEVTLKYTGRGYKDEEFRYRLYIPEPDPGGQKQPLLVWLHGLGERGSDNQKHLRWLDRLIFKRPLERKRFPFFVLAVQCRRNNGTWTTSAEDQDDMINVCMAALKKTLQEHPSIDTDRISLAGISAGGSGCWEMAIRHTEVFSCVAPIASGGADLKRIDRLVDLPVWAFHCNKDRSTPPDGDRESIAALEELNGIASLTEFSSTSHDAWTPAFNEERVLYWLLDQKRVEKVSFSERARNWFAASPLKISMISLGSAAAFLMFVFLPIRLIRRRTRATLEVAV